jgi:hypothetical protein
MPSRSAFTADKDAFTGTLRTLTLNVKVKLVPNDKAAARTPRLPPASGHSRHRRGVEEDPRGGGYLSAFSRVPWKPVIEQEVGAAARRGGAWRQGVLGDWPAARAVHRLGETTSSCRPLPFQLPESLPLLAEHKYPPRLLDGELETGVRVAQDPLRSARMGMNTWIVARHRLPENRLDHFFS